MTLSEVILDVQPARGCHYRLKSGVFIDRNEFEYFLKTGKLSSVQYLGLLEKKLKKIVNLFGSLKKTCYICNTKTKGNQ